MSPGITGSPHVSSPSATFANFRVRTLIANDGANRSHNSPGATSAGLRVKPFTSPRRPSGFKITVLPRRFRDAPKRITRVLRTLVATCLRAELLILVVVGSRIDPSPLLSTPISQPAARSRLDAATSSDQMESLQLYLFIYFTNQLQKKIPNSVKSKQTVINLKHFFLFHMFDKKNKFKDIQAIKTSRTRHHAVAHL